MAMNVAIDGPAGAGKSTIAKAIAAKMGYVYVDTGAMYRAMALYFLRAGIASNDEEKISSVVDDISVSIKYEDGAQHVILNGEDVTGLIRTEEVGNMASASSVYAPVRSKLVALQQELAKTTDVIMDGRDIGTVVLPNAAVKIFQKTKLCTVFFYALFFLVCRNLVYIAYKIKIFNCLEA